MSNSTYFDVWGGTLIREDGSRLCVFPPRCYRLRVVAASLLAPGWLRLFEIAAMWPVMLERIASYKLLTERIHQMLPPLNIRLEPTGVKVVMTTTAPPDLPDRARSAPERLLMVQREIMPWGTVSTDLVRDGLREAAAATVIGDLRVAADHTCGAIGHCPGLPQPHLMLGQLVFEHGVSIDAARQTTTCQLLVERYANLLTARARLAAMWRRKPDPKAEADLSGTLATLDAELERFGSVYSQAGEWLQTGLFK